MQKMHSALLLFLFATVQSIITGPLDSIGTLFEHSNITLQKNFDAKWCAIFAEQIDANPVIAAQKFKEALEKNPYTSPHTFLLGLSSSAYQVEGGIGPESSWYHFAERNGFEQPGLAVDFWNQYPAIIKEMKEQIGINAYRLSISWERVQPEKDVWNYDAINHYVKIVEELRKNGIEPLIVLHHYTVPTWFEELGGFTKEENIKYFVEFAKVMYTALHDKVIYWSTFNAIEGYAFKGYWQLDGPPGKPELKSMQTTVEVMKNMLRSHVEIYYAIKGGADHNNNSQQEILLFRLGLYQELQKKYPEKNIPEPQIGIQKNIIPLDIAHFTNAQYGLAPITGILCSIGNTLQNKGFYGLFATGVFSVHSNLPTAQVHVEYCNLNAPYTLDWIGVNIYANKLRFLLKDVADNDPERLTDNLNYRFYPEGIERAVKEICNNIVKPLYAKTKKLIHLWITENGIATNDDVKRTRFFERTLLVIRTLLEQNYPIMGYTPWASHDNYEWPSKVQPDPFNSRRYGMFHVDFESAQRSRTLKPGANYFAQFTQVVNQRV